jgi:hypothetical protein
MESGIANKELVELSPEQLASADLTKLIRKLRWIGLEEDAHRLQVILSRFPADVRATIMAGPLNTD